MVPRYEQTLEFLHISILWCRRLATRFDASRHPEVIAGRQSQREVSRNAAFWSLEFRV